jgi:NhaP-type Na+/H+ or K+/H+ antiporter
MWRYLNGGMLKLLGVVGVVALTMLLLILLNWLADTLLDEHAPTDIWKAFVTVFTLLIGGSAGAKYVSGLEVKKKELPDG